MSYKVVITDYKYPDIEQEKQVFSESKEEIEIIDLNGKCKKPEDILKYAPNADAIITQFIPMEDDFLKKLDNCKIIVRYAIGVDIIDLEAAKKHKIKVANVPDYCINEVSDHALALILNSIRKICFADKKLRKTGEYSFKIAAPIHRIESLNLGLVAFGAIARRLYDKIKALGFKGIYVYDPYFNEEEKYPEVNFVELDELLINSDIVSLHAPATKETENMINEKSISLMKDKAVLINTSRGALVDEDALYNALKSGKLQSAALDVLKEEQSNILDNKLFELENVIFTPHMAWHSSEGRFELQRKAAEQVRMELEGKEPNYWLNK